jgi:hypothetical protein
VSNFSGKWIGELFQKRELHKSTFPLINQYINDHPWAWKKFCVGNIVVEIVLPLLTLLTLKLKTRLLHHKEDAGVQIRLAFHCACLAFHGTIYLLMNPSFPDYICLHVLAIDPLWCLSKLWQLLNDV